MCKSSSFVAEVLWFLEIVTGPRIRKRDLIRPPLSPLQNPLHEAHEALLFAMETAANSGTSHIESTSDQLDARIEADESFDDEGYAQSTSTSYVTSLASDIRRGVEENGRLYASYGKYKQMIPIDESEVRYPPATSWPSNDVIRTFSWIATTSNTASSPFFKKADFTSPQSPQHLTGSSTLERGPVSGPSILQINTSQPMSSAPTLLPSNQIM